MSEKNLNCPDVIKKFELENSQQLTQPKKKSPSRITITRKKRDEDVYSDEEIIHGPNRRTKRSKLFCVFIWISIFSKHYIITKTIARPFVVGC